MAGDSRTEGRYPRKRSHGTVELETDAGEEALPPYQVRDVDMIYVEGVLAPKYAKAILPAGIEQAPSHACMVASYTAPRGWGLAPFTATYARLAISGHVSPDGNDGLLPFAQTASGRAGRLIHRHYNRFCSVAETSFSATADRIEATGPLGEGAEVEIAISLGEQPVEVTAGAHTEVGLTPDGLATWATAYSCAVKQVRLERLGWSIPEGHRLEPLLHFRPTATYRLFDKSFSMGAPSALRVFDPRMVGETQASLIDLFERLHLKAIVMERGGRLAFVSEAARAALGDIAGSQIIGVSGKLHQLASMASRAQSISPINQPILLERSDGRPIIVRALPLTSSLWGSPAVLGLVNEPGESRLGEPETILHLMGLTPAEARIAHLVGLGATRGVAARKLGVSENTIRSTLKVVHSKLKINRRAELANLVAHFSTF